MRFSDLIEKYSKEVELIVEKEGHYEGPRWVDGETTKYTGRLAIFYMTPEDIEYYEGGNYTKQDIKAYAPEYLEVKNVDTQEKTTITLDTEDKIVFRNDTFEIQEHQPKIHVDYHVYVAKKVND